MKVHFRIILTLLLSSLFFIQPPAQALSRQVTSSTVEIISAKRLHEKLEQVLLIDVRSAFEYRLFHIDTAVNIPSSEYSFLNRVADLKKQQPEKQLVFYCNGGECKKSFQAAHRYMHRFHDPVQVYHDGLKQWAISYPEDSVMKGQSPVINTHLIDQKHFKKHLLDSAAFSNEVEKRNCLLLDIRDRTQRSILSLFIGYEFHSSLDDEKLFSKYISQAKKENRTLLVYDAAGKQVEWLMYYLEARGIKSYYFLEGGAEKYFKDITASL